MQVTVLANTNNNVTSAISVVFDFEAEGPVSDLTTSAGGLSKQFTVLGTTVLVDKTTTIFDDSANFNFASSRRSIGRGQWLIQF